MTNAARGEAGRRRHRRGAAGPSLLLCCACLGYLAARGSAALLVPAPNGTDFYRHDLFSSPVANYPAWQADLCDYLPLSALTLPGSHDTMTASVQKWQHSAAAAGSVVLGLVLFMGPLGVGLGAGIPECLGDWVMTQTMTLHDQLLSGIRAVDIRCWHRDGRCQTNHGFVDLYASLDDVLGEVCGSFLRAQPSEFVVMRISADHTDGSWEATFMDYRRRYPDCFWTPQNTSAPEVPTVGQVRQRIVLLQDFDNSKFGWQGLPYPNGDGENGCPEFARGTFGPSVQDCYQMRTNWGLYSKWLKVKAMLNLSAAGDPDTLHLNYLSGSGAFPYFVASGQSSPENSSPQLMTGSTCIGASCLGSPEPDNWAEFPRVNCLGSWCSIAFYGTNKLLGLWPGWTHSAPQRLGIIYMDFPGPDLITRLIGQNPGTCPTPAAPAFYALSDERYDQLRQCVSAVDAPGPGGGVATGLSVVPYWSRNSTGERACANMRLACGSVRDWACQQLPCSAAAGPGRMVYCLPPGT